MVSRKEIAAEKKRCNSHNCAQAILHTYADVAGISEEAAMNIAGAFGGGMGNMEGTCGALVGAGLVLGLVNKDKVKSMKQMRQIMTRFRSAMERPNASCLRGWVPKTFFANVLFVSPMQLSFWKNYFNKGMYEVGSTGG